MIIPWADNRNPNSLASRLRRQRTFHFAKMLELIDSPVRILDVGGTVDYWIGNSDLLPAGIQLTLLNLEKLDTKGLSDARSVIGDARKMPFSDQEFDAVFSNSVIEHVGTLYDQMAMAQEIQRVAKRYFVQTPNRYFPIEPHFIFPMWQFLPLWFRAWLHSHTTLGWMTRESDAFRARANVEQLRLLSSNEMKRLFPTGRLIRENLGLLTKSLIALRD